MTILLDVLYGLAFLVASPFLIRKQWRRGQARSTWAEWFGNVPSRRVASHCVWVHGVSLGEINATRTVVAELRKRRPDWAVVISSTTQTGLTRARELYPDLLVFRYPLDFSFAVRRVLKRIRPTAIVLMELEVWPNLIAMAAARGIPVLIANGRITEGKSMRRFKLPVVRSLARRMFRNIAWVGAQDQTYADRFAELQVSRERIEVTGSLKYDSAEIADHIPGQEQVAADLGLDLNSPIWVCGSTGPGEEELLLAAHARAVRESPGLQLVLVPRKPERFDEVARTTADAGFACVRRSASVDARSEMRLHASKHCVFLGDTMGELRKFYALAHIVFVGRTLTPLGGSDVMEIAGLAKPMLIGPHVENFADAVGILRTAGALVEVHDVESLIVALLQLLRSPEECRRMGLAGRAAIVSRRGATHQTVERILAFCEQSA